MIALKQGKERQWENGKNKRQGKQGGLLKTKTPCLMQPCFIKGGSKGTVCKR
jgi:hypothetical protein